MYVSCADCTGFAPFNEYLWPIYTYGDHAVQLFWMISGVVMAAVYMDRDSTTRDFLTNRFARLYPLHFVTLMCVVILQTLAISTWGRTLIYGGFSSANLLLHLGLASNWFNNGLYTFNGPIWSVSAEIAVYVLFWLFRRRLADIGLAAMAGLVIISFLGVGVFAPSPVPLCAGYFLTGVAVARWGIRHPASVCILALAVSIALSSLGACGARDLIGYLGVTGAVCLFVGLGRFAGSGIQAGTRWLADCTYGLYLWHVPVQLALMIAIGPGGPMVRVASSPYFAIAWLLGMVLIARASFTYLEAPARRRLRDALSRRNQSFVKVSDNVGGFT